MEMYYSAVGQAFQPDSEKLGVSLPAVSGWKAQPTATER